jgi:antitoxin component YwqK of YwqJK toxin-antitoxin module
MKQLLISIMLTLSFVCHGQINSHEDIDYNDIVEKKGLFYFKKDSTLVTGRVIFYNRNKVAKRYVFITEGKSDNLGWIQLTSNYKQPQESVFGTVLTGAAVVTGAVLAVSGNDLDVPVQNSNNRNSANAYYNEQRDNTSKVYKEMSERNDISQQLNTAKETGIDFSDGNSSMVLLETKGNYVDDKKDGVWEVYFSNGMLKSKGAYIEDNKDGLWVEYHENGAEESTVNYNMGKKEGFMKVFQANNILKARVHYKDGMEDGVGEYYDEQGKIELKVNYKKGKEDDALEYYKNGQLVKIEFWKDGVLINN